jgi:hypothetical protein
MGRTEPQGVHSCDGMNVLRYLLLAGGCLTWLLWGGAIIRRVAARLGLRAPLIPPLSRSLLTLGYLRGPHIRR